MLLTGRRAISRVVSNGIDVAKIFALADELTPGIGTYGFVYNEGEVNSQSIIEKTQRPFWMRGASPMRK